jgi:hypothetical protein
MTTTNSFVPPPELVQQWLFSDDYPWGPPEQTSITITTNRLQNVATQAAQWGSDQELEACCEWLAYEGHEHEHLALRAARRPKPPSLKEQALTVLDDCANCLDGAHENTIRRALEALDD